MPLLFLVSVLPFYGVFQNRVGFQIFFGDIVRTPTHWALGPSFPPLNMNQDCLFIIVVSALLAFHWLYHFHLSNRTFGGLLCLGARSIWMNEWMDEWMKEWTNEWMKLQLGLVHTMLDKFKNTTLRANTEQMFCVHTWKWNKCTASTLERFRWLFTFKIWQFEL